MNNNDYNYETILNKKLKVIYIDVRSPLEYNKEHIPGAINIPVLDDEQRKEVGTIYKQIGRIEAVEKGLELVGPNLVKMYQEYSKYYQRDYIYVIYCARGGMRSRSITSLLKVFGLPIYKLEDGYKGYREYINNELPKLILQKTFITLYGKTGTGKTKLLIELSKQGFDILDLEGCANHRGSLLGSINKTPPYSQKQFESLVFDSLYNASTDIIFCEGESKRIGNVVMKEDLFKQINSGYKIQIDAPLSKRIKIIKEEYLSKELDNNEVLLAFDKLSRYQSKDKINLYTKQLLDKEYDELISNLMIDYYDRVYTSKNQEFNNSYINNDESTTVDNILKDYISIINNIEKT